MPDSTPDEAAALADAETYTRAMAERRKHHGALATFVAGYDRRAEEIAALRAELERSTELGQQAIAAEARAVRELEAENAGLRTELLTTQQILAHAERQRDEAEARLAAQQPVVDAAQAWENRPSDDKDTEDALLDALHEYAAALSGSVEAADTPPSGTSGHEAPTELHADLYQAAGKPAQAHPAWREDGSAEALAHDVVDMTLRELADAGISGHEADTPAEPDAIPARPVPVAPAGLTATLAVDLAGSPRLRLNIDPRCLTVAAPAYRADVAHAPDCSCGDMGTRLSLSKVAGTPAEPDLLGRLQTSIERAREARRDHA